MLFAALLPTACKSGHHSTSALAPQSDVSSSSPVQTWASVTDVVTFCDQPKCPGGSGFTVRHDGSYYVGTNGELGSGLLTQAELAHFKSVADPVAAQTGFSLDCVPNPNNISSIRTYSTTMNYLDQSSQVIVSVSAANSCFYGNGGLDTALHTQLQVLENKYDAIRVNPGASPPGGIVSGPSSVLNNPGFGTGGTSTGNSTIGDVGH